MADRLRHLQPSAKSPSPHRPLWAKRVRGAILVMHFSDQQLLPPKERGKGRWHLALKLLKRKMAGASWGMKIARENLKYWGKNSKKLKSPNQECPRDLKKADSWVGPLSFKEKEHTCKGQHRTNTTSRLLCLRKRLNWVTMGKSSQPDLPP